MGLGWVGSLGLVEYRAPYGANKCKKVYLPNSIAVLVVGPTNIDGVVLFIEPTLNRSGGDVTIAGVDPGQVAVTRSDQDVVIFFGNLLSTIGDVASVVVRVHLSWEKAAFMFSPADIEGTTI